MEHVDIVIVGGGGVGSAIAYFLSAFEPQGLRVVVCERDPSYAHAATALAAGGIRQQFSTPENVLMSQFGYRFIEAAEETLAVDGFKPALGLVSHPYLRLESDSVIEAVRTQADMQRELGATPELFDRGALKARFPWMHVDDIGIGVLGGAFEGVFDPFALLQALRRKSIAQGVDYRHAEVAGFERAGSHIAGVKLANGERIGCEIVVNAAGARAGMVAALAGLDLPVGPLKAHTFAFRPAAPIPDCPIVLDHVAMVNFKPEGPLFLAASPRESVLRGQDDFDEDPALFEEYVWPALAHRAPLFEQLKLQRGWVGHIEWNAFDANPVLGAHPDQPRFLFANGLSGHGVQHLPAIGRAIAELIVFGEYRALDLSRFGYERLVRERPLRETV